MRNLLHTLVAALLLAASLPAFATVFARVHGVVHDPQHRPIAGATVALQAADSDFALRATTNADGEFELPEAPIGVYRLTVSATGFANATLTLEVNSGTNPVLHIPLDVAGATQSVVVNGEASAADTVTPTTLITRQTINETPGADRTIGTEMITDYVPGAYMTHDMLHMRGGHQTSWLIDGVAIPNTKIASNVGPQIDPKDIDSHGRRSAAVTTPTWATALTECSTCCRATDSNSTATASCCSTAATFTPARRRFRWATTQRRPRGTRA